MITFNQQFYDNLATYIHTIATVSKRLNSFDIVVNVMHPNSYKFDTHQFKADNPSKTAFVTIHLQEGEDVSALPLHLFSQMRVDFFDKFRVLVGEKLFKSLVICPQLNATFSVEHADLDDVLLGALVLKYMAEYYLQMRQICLITPENSTDALFNLSALLDAVANIKLPDFKTVYISRDVLSDHVLANVLMCKHAPLL